MKTVITKTAVVSVIGLLSACGVYRVMPPAQGSHPESVEIPQTPVEDQQKIGFCWAYAGIGLIESDYKLRMGTELALSEEALGFYRMAEGLYLLTQNLSGPELRQAIREGSLEGWLLKAEESFPDTFALIEKYGVVPESVWTYKFTSAAQTEKLTTSIKLAMLSLVKQSTDPRRITIQQIVREALLVSGAWQSAPPSLFEVNGMRYTPQEYLQFIGFHPEAYDAVSVERPADVEKLIAATKRALVRGVSVPLGYPVNFARLDGDTFSGQGVDLMEAANFFKEGGHAVLIKDFINKGGVEGALPIAQLLTEFLKPTTELNFFVFKNSWGTDAKTNEAGHVIRGSKTGYYKIDRDYLQGAANMTFDRDYAGILEVIVPRDIANNPFGSEPVNPAIALK